MADNKIYITQEGLINLQNELEELKTVKRLEIAEKLKEAISYGDLSENSEYEDARNEQAQVERRINDLEAQLKNIEIIDENSSDSGKIGMGSIVEIENLEDSEKVTLKVVGSTEADILGEPKTISNESPLGKSLLGKKKGQKIKVRAMKGTCEYKILKIK